MPDILIDSTDNITLVGGAPVSSETLDQALAHAPVLIAADGGAMQALARGHTPVAVIGDMDSIDIAETRRNSDIKMYSLSEQDTTDFEKCLYSVRAPLILGCGFLGGRIDHALAALHALIREGDRPVILLGEHELVLHCARPLDLALAEGAVVSFYPLAPVRGAFSEGLRWPIDGLAMAPGVKVGTSNAATGGRMRAAFDAPGMLAILPLGALPQLVRTLSTPAR